MTVLNCSLLLCLILGCVTADSLEATVGQDVTITCKYDAKYYGKLSVCWGRGAVPNSGCANEVIKTDGTTVTDRVSERYVLFGNLEEGDVSLTIRQLEEADSGTYGCRVDIPGWFNDHKHETVLTVVPARPNPLKVEPREVKEESITVRWGPVFDGGRPITSYRIDQKNKQAPWDTAIRTELYDPQLTQVTLVDLRPARTYNLRMFALNSVGLSNSSNVLTVTTKEAAPGGPPLETQLEAVSSQSIRVTWKAPRSDLRNGVLRSYRLIYREYNQAEQQSRLWQHAYVAAASESQSYILTNLKPSTKYEVLVQARTNAGTGPPSTAQHCVTLDEEQTSTTPPNTRATSPTARKWTNGTSDTTTKTMTTTTTTITTATPPCATVWESASSFNLASPDPPFLELKGFLDRVKEGVFSLLWTPGLQGDSPITGYCLEYKTSNASWDQKQTFDFTSNETEITILEFEPSTYNIRIFARNTFGSSKASNVLTLTVEEKEQQQYVPASTRSLNTDAESAEESSSGHLAAILVPVLLVLTVIAILGTWQLRRIRQKKGTVNMWLENGVLRYRETESLQESL